MLATPVQFGFGMRFYRSAYGALRHGSTNMDVLVALGSSAAYFYSVGFTSVAIATHGKQAAGQQCFETAAMLITFILLGKWLEATARGKASEAMSTLLRLQPVTALVCVDPDGAAALEKRAAMADAAGALDGEKEGGEAGGAMPPILPPTPLAAPLQDDEHGEIRVREAAVSGLTKGDVIKVLPGAQVPLDGIVLDGASSVNEAMLTGEAMPVIKVPTPPLQLGSRAPLGDDMAHALAGYGNDLPA